MKQHVTIVGILHVGMGILGILTALIVMAVMIGPGIIIDIIEGDSEPLTIGTIIGGSVGLFLITVSLPGVLGGMGLLKLQPWARYLVMLLGVLNLVNIPFGTAAGIYTLWVLMQGETEGLFTGKSPALASVHSRH